MVPSISVKFALLLACRTSQSKCVNNGLLKDESAKKSFSSLFETFISMMGNSLTCPMVLDEDAFYAGDAQNKFSGIRPWNFIVKDGLLVLGDMRVAADDQPPDQPVPLCYRPWSVT